MKSFVLFVLLYILSAFMIALAASGCEFFTDYRMISYFLLGIYNFILLLFVFFETLCIYSKTENRILAHPFVDKYVKYKLIKPFYCILTIFSVLLLRQILYEDVDSENYICVLRLLIVLLFIIFCHYSGSQEARFMFYMFAVLDFVLSFIYLNIYFHKDEASKSLKETLILRAILISAKFIIVIFKGRINSGNSIDINVIEKYTRNAQPREFRKHLSFVVENECQVKNFKLVENLKKLSEENYVIRHAFTLINNVDLIKENLALVVEDTDIEDGIELISHTVQKMEEQFNTEISKMTMPNNKMHHEYNTKATEEIGMKMIFLATIFQVILLSTKYNEGHNKLDERTFFFDSGAVLYKTENKKLYEINSLIFCNMQILLNYSEISRILCTMIINVAFYIWQTTFKVIYDQFKVNWQMTIFVVTVVFNAFVFIFIFENIVFFGTEFVESTVKQLSDIQHNIETTRNIRTHNLTTGTTIFERYPGEDVSIHCAINHNFKESWRTFKLFWTQNDLIMDSKGSDRLTITTKYYDHFAESELTLLLIEDNDFGKIECLLYEVQYVPVIHTFLWNGQIASYLFEVILSDFQLKFTYELRHIAIQNNTYEIAEGSLIVFDIFAYYSYTELEDISFQYTVNDIDIHDLCTRDWLSCKPLAYVQKKFMNSETSRWKLSHLPHNTFRLYLQFCACSKIFGVHRLFLYRDYHNKTSGKTETKEIEYPLGFLFLPKGNDTGIRKELFMNNTSEFINRYLEINDQIVIPMYFGSKLRISVYSAFNFIAFLIYFVVSYFVMKVVNYVMYLYCCVTIIPVRNILLYGSVRKPVPQIDREHFAGILPCQDTIYDVYISFSEIDNDFTEGVILPYIEQECEYKVCFPPRDLAHTAGSLLQLYMKATAQSRQFIVILSHSYLEDSKCNGVQLLTCILPLLADQTEKDNKMLIVIKLEQVDLPVQICRNPRISVIDWTFCNDDRHNLRKIKKILSNFDDYNK